MSAKDDFAKLGYNQIVHEDKARPTLSGIQYVKRDPDSEMLRVGMVTTKFIEFYPSHKEILMLRTTQFRDGSVSKSDISSRNSVVRYWVQEKDYESIRFNRVAQWYFTCFKGDTLGARLMWNNSLGFQENWR